MDYDAVLAKRRAHIGPNTTLVYKRPLHMVRGEGCRLWDADGNEYLDCVNNVAHVGHCHPKVRPCLLSAADSWGPEANCQTVGSPRSSIYYAKGKHSTPRCTRASFHQLVHRGASPVLG